VNVNALNKLTGWQIVTLVGLVLGTIIALVAMKQQLSAIVAAAIGVASLLGLNVVQVAAANAGNAEKMGQLKEQGNGNLAAANQRLTDAEERHALERQQLMDHNAALQKQVVGMAALVPPEKALLVPQLTGVDNGQFHS
jgi:hypothetical protein